MGTPTRFTYGIATVAKGKPLGDYPLPDPFHTTSDAGLGVFSYTNDFVDLGNTASRTVTGGAAFALADGINGIGVLTPVSATAASVYRTAATFQFIGGQKFWFLHRIKASAIAGVMALNFGMSKVSGGTIATTDRLYFTKPASSTSLNLVSVVNNTSTTLLTGITTVAADTYLDVGFYFDGTDLQVFVSDNMVARVPGVTIGATGTTISNAVMSPFFGLTPVATETVTIDYAIVAQETTR